MVRPIQSKLPLFVTFVLLIFAMHFALGMIYRANPNPNVSDSFDVYLKPGLLVLLTPFLLLSKLFPPEWGQGDIFGVFIYFGAMFLYSLLQTLAIFGIYKVLRKVITWRHQDKFIFHHRTGFSSGGQQAHWL